LTQNEKEKKMAKNKKEEERGGYEKEKKIIRKRDKGKGLYPVPPKICTAYDT